MSLTNKKILIQGAGRGHLGLISTCKKLGVRTIVTGLKGNYPCIPLADKFVECDIRDKGAVLRIAEEEKIDGIIICCSDTGLETVGFVNDKMGLHGITEEAAKLCSDKLKMKERLVSNGVRTAHYFPIENKSNLTAALYSLDFPMILKATDLQGSRGIYIVNSVTELYTAYDEVCKLTNKPYCVLEEFITGREFGAQAFVTDGEMLFILPHGDDIIKCETNVPIGHYIPYDVDQELSKEIYKQVSNAVIALGVNNCAVNVDLIERDGKVYIIELTGRVGANCLPELTSNYFGIDYYEMIIEEALGGNPKKVFERSKEKMSTKSMMLKSEESGRIEKISVEDSDNTTITLFVKKGDHIRTFANSNDAIGQIITKGKTLGECDNNLNEAMNNIKIEVSNDVTSN